MNLSNIRKNKNITQNELANMLNVDQTTISKWEKGKAEVSLIYIPKLSKIFNVSIEQMVDAILQEEQEI